MMSRNSSVFMLALCLFAGVLIAGCTQQPAPVQVQTSTPTAVTTATPSAMSIANPASVNCGNLSGTTVIMKNPDGSEYGMCTFNNGTSCEEWALFRGEGCKAGGK
jgi:putative hemolysin